jgi:shikimate kinase
MKLFLLGFMGSGKTYWGRKLSRALKLPLFDLDEQIAAAEGMTIAEILTHKGEAYFRELEREALRAASAGKRFVVSCGGGAPCFFDNMEVMNESGLTIWLDAPVSVMVERLKRRRHERPLIRELDDTALTAYVKQKLEERRPFYSQARLALNPEHYDLSSLTEKIKSCKEPF